MAVRTSGRQRTAARIALLTRHRGPDDPEIGELRTRLAAEADADNRARIAAIADWAARTAATMPALSPAEITAAGRLAAVIDARAAMPDEG